MTPTQEERLAVIEQKMTDANERFQAHISTCHVWQQQLVKDVGSLKDAALKRLAWPWVVAFTVLGATASTSITLLVQHLLSQPHAG